MGTGMCHMKDDTQHGDMFFMCQRRRQIPNKLHKQTVLAMRKDRLMESLQVEA